MQLICWDISTNCEQNRPATGVIMSATHKSENQSHHSIKYLCNKYPQKISRWLKVQKTDFTNISRQLFKTNSIVNMCAENNIQQTIIRHQYLLHQSSLPYFLIMLTVKGGRESVQFSRWEENGICLLTFLFHHMTTAWHNGYGTLCTN